MMARRSTAVIVVGLVAAVALVAGFAFALHGGGDDKAGAPDPQAATALFYAQRYNDATGTERAMADHRGRVVVVNFWATWCAPCVEEIPMFSRVSARHAGRVDFVGLGIDSPGNIAGFYLKLKPSYPLVVAGAAGTDLTRALGNPTGALPFTVVLGPDGKILASKLGRVDEATLEGWITSFAPAAKTAAASTARIAPS